MKALVYHGPGSKAWEEVPDASIVGVSRDLVKSVMSLKAD